MSPHSGSVKKKAGKDHKKMIVGVCIAAAIIGFAAMVYLAYRHAPEATAGQVTAATTQVMSAQRVCGNVNPMPELILLDAAGNKTKWDDIRQTRRVPSSKITGCTVEIVVDDPATYALYDRQCRDAYGTWHDSPPELKGRCREFRIRCKAEKPCKIPTAFEERWV